jgi:hypothetical protein
MTRGSDIPKASPESVALAIFDAVDGGNLPGSRLSAPGRPLAR